MHKAILIHLKIKNGFSSERKSIIQESKKSKRIDYFLATFEAFSTVQVLYFKG